MFQSSAVGDMFVWLEALVHQKVPYGREGSETDKEGLRHSRIERRESMPVDLYMLGARIQLFRRESLMEDSPSWLKLCPIYCDQSLVS